MIVFHQLEGTEILQEEEKSKVLAVSLPWDLPGVTTENRWWLRDRILIHAVSVFQMLRCKNMNAHEQYDTAHFF